MVAMLEFQNGVFLGHSDIFLDIFRFYSARYVRRSAYLNAFSKA